ncbi:MAG: hypothetical protein AUG13_03400 [Chloroflexi bacterium 13_1_20CM_2_59_7]|nr:MAG: hypothetical protein AUG13_03400 [Chloroflexi bacterium 13_1_20CM_2_59_7]
MLHLAVDTGTTNTTVWLVENDRILRNVQRPVGVRNTSITGSHSLLYCTLRESFLSLTREAPSPPRFVLAGGMITSSLGLVEVPHVLAPAGAEKLSRHVLMKTFPEVCPLPFFLVPGVRIQRAPCQLSNAERTDIIRGEETEIVGLLARRNSRKPWLFVHLGSHAKAIQIDGQGRIVKSTTTLSGECLDVLRTQTILANRLARLGSCKLNERFFFQGARCAKRHGLLRALFMVRLLEENPRHRPADLYSFLVGALLLSDLHAFESQGLLESRTNQILLSGHPDLLAAWSLMLRKKKHEVEIVSPQKRFAAFLAGLRRIVFDSQLFRRFLAQEGSRRSG